MCELGLSDTLNYCEKVGLKTIGTDQNIDDTSKPLFITLNNINLTIFSFTGVIVKSGV